MRRVRALGRKAGQGAIIASKRICAPALAASLLCGSAFAQTYGPEDTETADVPARNVEGLPAPLVDAAKKAVSQNPQVLAQLAELAALESELNAAKWQRAPNLSAEVLATTGGSSIADQDGLAFNVALEQPIWAGGGIGAGVDAARAGRNVGESALRQIRYDIVVGIASAYFEALTAFNRAKALEAGLADMATLVASIERRVEREVSPAVDLVLARSRVTQLEVDLATAREQGENALLRLQELVGDRLLPPVMPQGDLTGEVPIEALALDEILGCSPALERSQREVDLASARADVTKSALWPQLLVQLSQNELTGARAALVLRWQSGNGLSRFAVNDAARARVDRAIALLGQADQEARRRISAEYVLLRSSQRRAEAGLLAFEAADALQASYQRQFVAGRRSWLDVINAAREKTFARVSYETARVSAQGAATRILALTCRWSPQGI